MQDTLVHVAAATVLPMLGSFTLQQLMLLLLHSTCVELPVPCERLMHVVQSRCGGICCHLNLSSGSPGGTQYDEKNIRRRVYDALNVLIAMEIISRSKKEILWHGLPSGHGNVLERTRAEKIGLNAQIDKQQNYLQVIPGSFSLEDFACSRHC